MNGSALAEAQRQRSREANQRPANPGPNGRYAVPRSTSPSQDGRRNDRDGRSNDQDRRDGRRYNPPDRRVYNSYNYYVQPRRSYGFGYSSPRLGFYYYAPYPRYRYDNRVFAWNGDARGYGGYGFGYPTGELHFEVWPQDAQVYVDGYYAGTVDDFDGFGQGLRLEEGPYTIEIVAPGFEPLSFDVRIQPGRQITYEGDLRREP